MKRRTFKVLAMSSLFVLLVGALVYAQAEQRINANIPFAFMVGNKTLPAGEYTIDRPNFNEPNVLLIRSADNHFAVFTNTESVKAKQMPNKSELVFNEIGDKYFLSKIWITGDDIGQEIPKPRAERELEQAASKSSANVVTVQPSMPGSQSSE